jgi:pre-rRNA-processing protein RIX1
VRLSKLQFQKQDPISTKKLSIITLTRIFHLTYQYQTLIREITTPSLPAFIAASLNLVSVKPSSEPTRILKEETPLLETILDAFINLVYRHPNIFRPFAAQIRSLLLPVIGGSSSAGPFPGSVVYLSQQLFISLHHCAPKNSSGEEWASACKLTIASTHRAANHVFRAVLEQWESTDPQLMAKPGDYSQKAQDDEPDPLGLLGWQGVHSGADRIISLLHLLSGFMSNMTASMVNVPLGAILDLTSRLTSVIVPGEGDDVPESRVQLNQALNREEREELYTELPRIHVACMDLLSVMVDILESGILSVAQSMFEQVVWVFGAEKVHREVRASSYSLITKLLTLIGPSMIKENVNALSPVLLLSCQDLFPSSARVTSQALPETKEKPKRNRGSTNADAFINSISKESHQHAIVPSFPGLRSAASQFLSMSLSYLPVEYFPHIVRAEIDRTAILIGDRNIMLASVMNPAPIIKGRRGIPSILPFLARQFPHETEVECLLRPRFPILMGAPEIQPAATDDDDIVAPAQHVSFNGAPGNTDPPASSNKVSLQTLSKRDHPEDIYPEEEFNLSTDWSENYESPRTKRTRISSEFDNGPSANRPLLKETLSIPAVPVAPVSQTETIPVALPETFVTAPLARFTSDATVRPTQPTTNIVQPTSSQPRDGVQNQEDNGDDEIPTLNIEPDTDEFEDEDGVVIE